MRFAISYGNGNDGLSRLFPAFTVEAPAGSEYILARLATISQFTKTGRPYIARNLHVDEAGEGAAQAVVYDPPRSPGWSEHNGAWKLADAFPADEASDHADVPHFESPAAAFGGNLVRAHARHA
jgi:hypothetical protein